ncbi:MAG TPA: galactokinase family protein [Gemmatimonadales bacterium]|nr:galactokinase family protein [Gemmatimonadales bacterium]
MTTSASARAAVSLFLDTFGGPPLAGASAPGRVNLIGEHTDYNGGPVLPLAIQRRTAVVAGPSQTWEAVSALDGVVERIDPDGPMRKAWTDYLAGIVRVLRRLRAAPSAARLAVAGDVPIGAGLSSSASLLVAAAKALSLLAGRRLGPGDLAEAAYVAEHDEVGVRCGRMDQTIAAHARPGAAILFETATGTIRQVPVPGRVWILETGVSHKLSGGALNQRRRECEEALAILRAHGLRLEHLADLAPEDLPRAAAALPPPLVPRVRHVVTETARTRAAADLLARGDLAGLGRLLREGHESLRTDYQSTIPEADFLARVAVDKGAYGARLSGAGWGGALVMLAPAGREARVAAELQEAFRREFGRTLTLWATRAAGGVRAEGVGAGRRTVDLRGE